MPLYEYHCLGCTLTFESLVPLNAARRSGTCPRCGRRSPRVTSAFAIAAHGRQAEKAREVSAAPTAKAERPLCMRYPEVPLLCHMDQKSAERFVAHVQGAARNTTIRWPRGWSCGRSVASRRQESPQPLGTFMLTTTRTAEPRPTRIPIT